MQRRPDRFFADATLLTQDETIAGARQGRHAGRPLRPIFEQQKSRPSSRSWRCAGRCAILRRPVTPTMAGMPYSRATTAPCVIIPPTSMISPAAVRNKGVQEGPSRGRPGSLREAGELRGVKDHPHPPLDAAGGDRTAGQAACSVRCTQALVKRPPIAQQQAWNLPAQHPPAVGSRLCRIRARQSRASQAAKRRCSAKVRYIRSSAAPSSPAWTNSAPVLSSSRRTSPSMRTAKNLGLCGDPSIHELCG